MKRMIERLLFLLVGAMIAMLAHWLFLLGVSTGCLILAKLIHFINPVWVALRSVPLGMSAALPPS